MKEIEFYHIDTFTSKTFKGNSAGVCRLNEWIDEKTMKSIANENNLSETAFYVSKKDYFEIRWFTPTTEVDLCGHATLATAFVEFEMYKNKNEILTFNSKSGNLYVKRENNFIQLDFPTDILQKIELNHDLTSPFKEMPIAAFKGKDDIMLVFEDEESIRKMKPRLDLISLIKSRGIIVTSASNKYDFVSRFFGPQSGIDEDPVTGSAHTTLIPYWSKKLNKNELVAKQLSARTGILHCKYEDERVKISGEAVLYKQGKILLT